MCSEARAAVSVEAGCREKETTDGMADSRSLMVRSGIITSFCATTLVTPSFVTVFMMKTRGKRERKGGKVPVIIGTRCLKRKQKKWGGGVFHFMGWSWNFNTGFTALITVLEARQSTSPSCISP
jgi:hypothetical protein